MTTSVDGLISGLSTTDTINQLMQVERQSQVRLTQQKTNNENVISTFQSLNSRMLTVATVAAGLKDTTGWQLTSATSSDSKIAGVTALGTALAGSLSFTVDRLATNQTLVSAGSVDSTSAIVATPNSHFLVSASSALGFSKLTGSNDLALGAHTVVVTQSSLGARQSGTALGTSVTLAAGATIELATDGSTSTTQTLNLTAGTYTRNQLTDMVSAASGGSVKASFGSDGGLRLTTVREGSAAQLAVTGGTALTDLGLSTSTSAASGTDGIVTVDGQATTLTDLSNGTTASLALAGGATLTATLAGGVRAGTSTITNVDFGDGKLSTVTAAVNSAGTGMQWQPVQIGAGVYRLQVASTTTGSAGRITSDMSFLDVSLGGMQTLADATDSQITVGTGPAAYTISSSSNRAEVLPGVTVNLLKQDPSTVTVTVAADANGMAGKVSNLIDAINGALSFINQNNKYDASTKKGGVLLSDSTARTVQQQLFGALGSSGKAGSLGITVQKDGLINFDQAMFLAAYKADPAKTEAMFTDTATGLGRTFETVGKNATDSTSGLVTTVITGKQNLSKTLTDQISGWDTRLSLREASLKRTFSNLEVSLGKMKSQSSWLSGQISSLPTNR